MRRNGVDFSVAALLTNETGNSSHELHRLETRPVKATETQSALFPHDLYLRALASLVGTLSPEVNSGGNTCSSDNATNSFGNYERSITQTFPILGEPEIVTPITSLWSSMGLRTHFQDLSLSSTLATALPTGFYKRPLVHSPGPPSLDLSISPTASPCLDCTHTLRLPSRWHRCQGYAFNPSPSHFESECTSSKSEQIINLQHMVPFASTGKSTSLDVNSSWGVPFDHPIMSVSKSSVQRRAVFSDYQRQGLEFAFSQHAYITKSDRRKVADKLGLKDCQVKIWFLNRRMKWRSLKSNKQLEHEPSKEKRHANDGDGERNNPVETIPHYPVRTNGTCNGTHDNFQVNTSEFDSRDAKQFDSYKGTGLGESLDMNQDSRSMEPHLLPTGLSIQESHA